MQAVRMVSYSGDGYAQLLAIAVYLPFDDPTRLVTMLKQLPNSKFVIYTPHVSVCSRQANVTIRRQQQAAFKDDLHHAAGGRRNYQLWIWFSQ